MKRLLILLASLLFSACSVCSAAGESSAGTGAVLLPDDLREELVDRRDSRIAEILSAPDALAKAETAIPGESWSGTAYYISPTGDDANDGLSPVTAKQSLDWLQRALYPTNEILQPGDAVFLERGGIYRVNPEPGYLDFNIPGITIGAYGEGAKPIITASPENGSGAEKWIEVCHTDDGVRIWQYYADMLDTASVVLNDGQEYADRVYEFFNGQEYVSCDAEYYLMEFNLGLRGQDSLLPLEETLVKDLQIVSRPDLAGRLGANGGVDPHAKGPLYLRCDRGNPGELYDSIEFNTYNLWGLVWLCTPDVTFDNISFRCGGTSFIKNGRKFEGSTGSDVTGIVIQNCEFAFGGGAVSFYNTPPEAEPCVMVQGDGVYCVCYDSVFRNNYCHDMCSGAYGFEQDQNAQGAFTGTLECSGNVMVNTLGIRLDNSAEYMRHYRSVRVRDNMVWDTGRMDAGNYLYSEGSVFSMFPYEGDYEITDNVFFCTENGSYSNALFRMYSAEAWPGAHPPRFSGNIYVQHAARNWAYWESGSVGITDENLLEKAARYIGDTDGRFYYLEDNVPESPPRNDSYGIPDDYDLAFRSGIVSPEWKDHDPEEQISSADFRRMLRTLIEQTVPESLESFDSSVTEYETPLLRGEAVTMAWYAARCIGADEINFWGYDIGKVITEDENFWDCGGEPFEQLFPGVYEPRPVQAGELTWDSEFIASFLWNLSHVSAKSNQMVVPYDEEAKSMRNHDPFTVRDAVAAVLRLAESRQ